MTMCAYSEDYLSMAQKVLGDMLDFAVNTCDFDIDQFFACFSYQMFLCSSRKEIRPILLGKQAANWCGK